MWWQKYGAKFYFILWNGMYSGLHFYVLEFRLLDDWKSWISLWSRLQGQSMPYCIPPIYRSFLFRGSCITITDHVIRLCLTKLNLQDNQLIKKASELPSCDWLTHCFRVSGGGGARSRAKPLSTGWMSKSEGQKAVPPRVPQPWGHLPNVPPSSPREDVTTPLWGSNL